MVNYSFKKLEENMAKAYGRDLDISTKRSTEICNFLRGKSLESSKAFLERVIEMKDAVPMRRFNRDTGHKKGIGPGRYPVNTAKAILSVLDNAGTNAVAKGFAEKDLVIVHICAHKAASPWHFGRQKRRKMKRSHIEVVVQEKKQPASESKTPKKQKVVKND